MAKSKKKTVKSSQPTATVADGMASTVERMVKLMNSNDLVELEIDEKGRKIRLRKAEAPGMGGLIHAVHASPAHAVPAATPIAAPTALAPGVVEVKSPIVGTFYRAPAPDADPFVEVGKRVTKESTVCIIEAMKVMNEIKAEHEGVIRQILVENGSPVEYGQVLFLVDTN